MYRNKEYLKKEYIEKGRSQTDIAKEWGVTSQAVDYQVMKHGFRGKSRRLYTCNESKFNLLNPIFNYYAGLIATDGYIDLKNNRVSLRLKNQDAYRLLSNLKEFFEFTGEIREYNGNFDLTITSEKLIKVLALLRIKGKSKTYRLKFPKIMVADEDCQRMFMRGILDGDGNIHVTKSKYTGNYTGGQFRLVTASRDFIEGVISFINYKLNLDVEMSIAKIKGVRYPKIEMKVDDSKKFYKWVYKGYENFRLEDKYSKYLLIR